MFLLNAAKAGEIQRRGIMSIYGTEARVDR